MQKLNYYEILGVSPDATKKELKTAYRRMAELHHPDKLKSSDPKLIKMATEEMILINEAKDVLFDDESRTKYDFEMRQQPSYTSYRQDEENALIRMIIQTQNILSGIGECGVDITEAEKYFFQAKYAFQNRYYRNGLELLQYAVRSAKDSHYQHAVRKILAARKVILAVEEEGFNIEFAKNILIQAKPAIEDGNYEQSTEFAEAAIKAAEKIKKKELEIRRREEEEARAAAQAAREQEAAQAEPKRVEVSWDKIHAHEEEGTPTPDLSPRSFIDRLTDKEFEELKAIMAEKENEIKRKKRLEKDIIKIELASQYKDIMLRFHDYQKMEEETIREIVDKFKGEEKEVVDFELDLDNMEFIDEEDIPLEDKEVIEASWNEEKIQKNISVYRSVLEEAWADGIVTEDEEAMLERLRASLGLPMDEHKKMEEDIIKKHLLNDYI